MLALADDRDIAEGGVVPELLEVLDHGRLVVVPSQTELLLLLLGHLGQVSLLVLL